MGRALPLICKKTVYAPSKFIGVSFQPVYLNGRELDIPWKGDFTNNKRHFRRRFRTEREAALWYDKKRIEFQLEPVNILKRKAA